RLNSGTLTPTPPVTATFVGTIEEQRAAAGEANTLLLSAGDSVGASLFTSFSQNDEPTIDLLNAMDVEASAVGNHEFDQGWPDLRDRIAPGVEFPYLGANVYLAGTSTPAMPAYTVVQKSGLRVGIVGAVTGELPSLVSPAGLVELTIGDPVAAVNTTIAALKDGDEGNGEADVIIAAYHEGAGTGSATSTLAQEVAASEMFSSIVNVTDPRAQIIVNAHTHQLYAWDGPLPGGGTRPIIQAASYASNVGRVQLALDATTGATCSSASAVLGMTSTPVDTLVAQFPRVAQASQIVAEATAQAEIVGRRVIGTATAPVTRALNPPDASGRISDDRARESSLGNLVAEMFATQLGAGDPTFIGMQNPGGTRDDLNLGEINYAEAANALPFANTLMTAELTGAQVKTVLEQQWQVTALGAPLPTGRKYLQLGLSPNVSYTYDESLPWGSRITSLLIAGQPIDPAATYTVGSGSFLIAGGDNFHELKNGANKRDTGRADLEAWVEFIEDRGTITPSYAMRGVSVHETPSVLRISKTYSFSVGVPQGLLAPDTLDLKTNGVLNTSLAVSLRAKQKKSGKWLTFNLGTFPVVTGSASPVSFTVPASVRTGSARLILKAAPSDTTVTIPVTISAK
ncbi:MAG: bifunctional UDP-sugar hydrolase/5'-nucleotidase, partial [Micropruina sp.]